MSMNSINSAHSGSRPKSTVPPSTTTVHLARSIGFNNLEGQSRNRATSRTSAQVPRSESAPVASQSTSTTQHLPPAAATRSTVGPSRPQLLLTSQKAPSRAIPERDIPPPQSAPLRPPPSFESAPKIMVAMRPDPAQFTGPSSFVVPSGPQRPGLISGSSEAGLQPHRVIGGARRVPLPPPPPPLPPLIEPTPVEISPLIKEATNARVPKQSTKSSHSRITSANAKSEDKKSPVTKSEDAPPAKLKAARKPDPQKPKAQPPPVVVATALSSSSTVEKHPPRGVKKPEAPSTSSVTTRRRGASSSRLTEPTQAQLARQKPAKHPSSQKHDPVKSTWGRSTTTKNLATKTSSSSRRPVSSIAAKSPLAASESAKQPQSAGQSDSKPAPASIPLPPSRSPTPPPQPEPEEVLTIEEIKESPVSPVLSPPIEPVSNDPPLPPQDAVENDEEEFIEESTMKPDTCTSVHLITFDSPTPSTPKAMFPRPQQVPETPISSLLASIENDLELSPAPAFDPDQTFTFGGLLQIERCEPLLLGRR